MKHIEDYITEDTQINEGIFSDIINFLFSKFFNNLKKISEDNFSEAGKEGVTKLNKILDDAKMDKKSKEKINDLYGVIQETTPEAVKSAPKIYNTLDLPDLYVDITRIMSNLGMKNKKVMNELKDKKLINDFGSAECKKLVLFIVSVIQLKKMGISSSTLSSIITTAETTLNGK